MKSKILIFSATYNESENITTFLRSLDELNLNVDVLIIDDNSPDKTWEIIQNYSKDKKNIHLIIREKKEGLDTAHKIAYEYAVENDYEFLITLDADLQHDVTLLPLMLEALNDDGLDMAIGSRYIFGGETGEWHPFRIFVSRTATRLSKEFIGNNITDPMSGFFMLRRTCFLKVAPSLSGRGFKILLDILISNNNMKKIDFIDKYKYLCAFL